MKKATSKMMAKGGSMKKAKMGTEMYGSMMAKGGKAGSMKAKYGKSMMKKGGKAGC